MANSDTVPEDEMPLAARKKANKRKRGAKKTPVKRVRKKQVRNLPAEKPIECPDCGLRFHWLSKLKDHQRLHTGEKPYECNYCEKSFSNSYSLKTHQYIHTDEKPYKCNFCAYACRDSSTLRKHHYRHMGIVQTYNCKMCAQSFSKKYTLKNHIAEMHLNVNLRTHKCEQCGKLFKSKRQVALHAKLVHDRVRETTCPICNKYLSNSSNLKTHLVSHVQERPYMCDFPGCDKRYKDKSTLVKHSRVHRPDKQFSCSVCGYLFTRPGRLRNHMIKVHRRSKCVECDYCGQKFYSKNYLVIHIKSKHDVRRQQYICDMCGFKANNKPGMVMHIKFGHDTIRSDVHCNLCRKTYKKHEYLKIHYKRAHNIAYKTNRDQKEKNTRIKGEIEVKAEPPDSEDETLSKLQTKISSDHTLKERRIRTHKATDWTREQGEIEIHKAKDQIGKDERSESHKSSDEMGIKIQETKERGIRRHKATVPTGIKRHCKKKATSRPSNPVPQPTLHKCDLCGRFFKKLSRLKSHMVKVHERSKCVSCEHCGQKFYSKNYLIDHMYKRHVKKKEYICDECGFKTHHKPGIAVHIKFAHNQAAVECDICNKKYKRLELLQFHYSEAHNTSYKITANPQQPIKDVIVKIEPSSAELDPIDLFEVEKHELIEDRSLTRDGATTLKGLIEKSGVRSVPDRVFEEYCTGHIMYLPAGMARERGKPTDHHFGVTDKKLEARANNHIDRLVSEARRKRAREKLERARQMYNQRMKTILEAKSELLKVQLSNRKMEKSNDKRNHPYDKANENDKKAATNNSDNISDKNITSLIDNSDVSEKSDDEDTKNNVEAQDNDNTQHKLESDVITSSDIGNTETNNSQQDVKNSNNDKRESLFTLLEELEQLSAEPHTSNVKEIYIEGKETTIKDVLTGDLAGNDDNSDDECNNEGDCNKIIEFDHKANERNETRKDLSSENKKILAGNDSDDEYVHKESCNEIAEFDEKANDEVDIHNDASKNKNKHVNNIELNASPKENINETHLVQDAPNELKETNQIRSVGNVSHNSRSTFTKVLLNDHHYAKSETTREIELKLLQCPEVLFDKSYDTSEEDPQKNLDQTHDVIVNDNVTLLDTGSNKKDSKLKRKPKLKLRKEITPTPETRKKTKVRRKSISKRKRFTRKKRYNTRNKLDVVYEDFDSTTPPVFDIPKKAGQRSRKQKLENRDNAEEELPLIMMACNSKNNSKAQLKHRDYPNNELKDTANTYNEISDKLTVKEENDIDNEINKNPSNKESNKTSTLSFKVKVLVEELLRSFNENEDDENFSEVILNQDIENSDLNADFVALLEQTNKVSQNEDQSADNENSLQLDILTGKLKELVASTPKPSNHNSLIAKALKSIEELISDHSPSTTDGNPLNSEDNTVENNNSLSRHETLQENTSISNNGTSQIKILSNELIVTSNTRSKRKSIKNRKYLTKTTDEQDNSQIKQNNDNSDSIPQGKRKQVKKRGTKRKLAEKYTTDIDEKSTKDEPVKRSTRKRILNKKYIDEDSCDDTSNEATSNSNNNNCEENSNKDQKKSSGKIIFNTHQCYVCFKVFETKESLISHCKTHFGVDREKSLKKCPLCDYTCTSGFSRHMKLVHDVSIKIPYARIQEELDGDNLKYYFEINDPNIKRVEVIPSVKNLNRRAMIEIDKDKREKDAKIIAKHKLVKKGNEWIVEKEEINLDNVVIPEFDKNIDISDKICDSDDYFDSLKKLYHVSKKAGKKMMFPCQHCEKICQNLAALKLHNRKHVTNPAPFAPKVWKHKLANPDSLAIRKVPKSNIIKKVDARKKTKKAAISKLETVNKSNIEDVLHSKDKRKAKPKPIKNKHRCDPQLQEFYKNNIRGGDIEFWQFLKIFNKMDRDNVNDFKDLEGKNDYGIDTGLQKDILEDSFILHVEENGDDDESKEYEHTTESNIIDKKDENITQNDVIGNTPTIVERQDVGNDKNETCTSKSKPNVTAGNKKAEKIKITKKFSKKDRKKLKRAKEIAKEIIQHSLPTHHE